MKQEERESHERLPKAIRKRPTWKTGPGRGGGGG